MKLGKRSEPCFYHLGNHDDVFSSLRRQSPRQMAVRLSEPIPLPSQPPNRHGNTVLVSVEPKRNPVDSPSSRYESKIRGSRECELCLAKIRKSAELL